jgi:hypothetical protein
MRQVSAFAGGARRPDRGFGARPDRTAGRHTPTRICGTIEKLDGQTLQVKSRDGQSLVIALAPNVTIAAVVKRGLADIKAGDYVASTSVKGTDGKLHAIEVHIFPEAMRGTAEGEFPWDLVPDSLMTNATVARPDPQGHLQGQRLRDHGIAGHSDRDLRTGRRQPAEAGRRHLQHRAEEGRRFPHRRARHRREGRRQAADVTAT